MIAMKDPFGIITAGNTLSKHVKSLKNVASVSINASKEETMKIVKSLEASGVLGKKDYAKDMARVLNSKVKNHPIVLKATKPVKKTVVPVKKPIVKPTKKTGSGASSLALGAAFLAMATYLF